MLRSSRCALGMRALLLLLSPGACPESLLCVVLLAAGKEKQAKLNAEKTKKTLAF